MHRGIQRFVVAAGGMAAAVLFASPVQAVIGTDAFVLPDSSQAFGVAQGWTRPGNLTSAANGKSTYQEWNAFTAVNTNAPDVGNLNPHGVADAYDGSGTATLFPSQNLYNFAIMRPQVEVPLNDLGGGYRTKFVVQVRTLGAQINPAHLRIDLTDDSVDNGTLISGLPDADHELIYQSDPQFIDMDGPGGDPGGYSANERHLWIFTLDDSPAWARLDFGAWPQHTSWDRVAVDTFASPVPEPAAVSLIGLAGASLLLRRRHRQS